MTEAMLRMMTNAELLRYVDRKHQEVAELALRIEEAVREIDMPGHAGGGVMDSICTRRAEFAPALARETAAPDPSSLAESMYEHRVVDEARAIVAGTSCERATTEHLRVLLGWLDGISVCHQPDPEPF